MSHLKLNFTPKSDQNYTFLFMLIFDLQLFIEFKNQQKMSRFNFGVTNNFISLTYLHYFDIPQLL